MADSNICGCCEGVTPLTPAPIENPPGQAALAYRVGTHARFKASMQAQIARQLALRELTTRDDDDASNALLDAWATTLDVLTFYQERIANENYLRTATERRSILEMARSIGYELRPGVAASTYLAFELENAPGSPEKVTLAIGAKAQTIPGQDEMPQTFETIEAIDARPEWNALKAKTTKEMLPVVGSQQLYLKGVTTQLRPGDGLLIVGKEREDDPASERWDFRRVTKVTPDNAANITLVEWAEKLDWTQEAGSIQPTAQNIRVYAFRQRAALFGHNAPDWRLLAKEARLRYQGKTSATVDDDVTPEWPGFGIASATDPLPPSATGFGLYGEYFGNRDLTNLIGVRLDATVKFDWAQGGPASGATNPIVGLDAQTFSVRWTGQVEPQHSETYTFFTQSDDGVRLWIDGKLIIDSWTIHGSKEDQGTITLQANRKYDLKLEYFEYEGAALIQLSWSSPSQPKEIIPKERLYPAQVLFLDNVYASILAQSWIVVSTAEYQEAYKVLAAAEAARKNYGLSGKVTRLELSGENLYEKYNFKLREAVVFSQSDELSIAEAPDTSPIAQGSDGITVQSKVSGLSKGRTLIVAGLDAESGAAVAEKVVLERLEQDGAHLVFQSNLVNSYKRDSVIVHANVAAATHGETKAEVLGSGDASQPFQKFVLKQAPLTYTATDQTPSGSITTLAVRVNDVLWEEAPGLYGLNQRDRTYVTRIGDDGKVIVMFGDGQSAARLPTGAENVQATYRVGTGLAGMVKAKQISLLLTRPLGAKGVSNPIAPEGGQDPETRDQARQNAPLTVLTLDRVVSLQDFEDFARAFGGIGKAQAVWLWDGERRIVHLTVAAANGGAVLDNSDLRKRLHSAIAAACDPTQHFRIDSYTPLTFKVVAKVKIDKRYLTDKVVAAITAAVSQAFAFDQRAFGRPVTASEVSALIQHIEGVVYVDLDSLQCVERPTMKPPLAAQIARWDNKVLKPAELLTLSQGPNSLQVIPIG